MPKTEQATVGTAAPPVAFTALSPMPLRMTQYGPWAVIAGASEGIGAAFARELATAGISLILIARRSEPLETLASELRTRVSVQTIPLDLGAADLEASLRAVAQRYEVGLLIYNAALSICAPFTETPLADKLRILDINTRGPLIAAHVFAEAMIARRRGGLIFMSSLTAFWGSAYLATYGATKAFNLALGEALSQELAKANIDVLVSCAGATSTPGFLRQTTGKNAPSSMPPETVARETLAALHKRGTFVPGRFNRMAQFLLSRLLPRRFATAIMASQTKKLLR